MRRQAMIPAGRTLIGSIRLAPDLIRLVEEEAARVTGGNRSAMFERILEERYDRRTPARTVKAAIERRLTQDQKKEKANA